MHVAPRAHQLTRASKTAHWRGLTAAERLRLGDELRRDAMILHADWPTNEQRALDVDGHVNSSARFERAAAAGKR